MGETIHIGKSNLIIYNHRTNALHDFARLGWNFGCMIARIGTGMCGGGGHHVVSPVVHSLHDLHISLVGACLPWLA
jgi:hypothetical protein